MRPWRRTSTLILTAAVLVSCHGTAAVALPASPAAPSPLADPVQPVSGLPAGTDGYPWWNDTVFYEVFVRSFYDSNGDGKGDLAGLTEKLDYLQSLGVTGLWLMPIQPATSYHGYDVLDYSAVNPDYGNLDDFREMLSEAHAHGMRVILDLVLNHTSNQHPWFQAAQDPASPYRTWYVWSPTAPDPNLWHPAGTPGSGYYYGFFGADMPDLNYNNPSVTGAMENVVRFWLGNVGVDGFRVDAAKYLIEEGRVVQNSDSTHAWYRGLRIFVKSINPQAMTVGEVLDISPTAASYAQGDQLDLTFDFALAQMFLISARAGRAEDALSTLTADTQRSFRPLQLAIFLTNHDENRARSQLMGSFDKARAASELLLTSPGVPFIYYGEEIGMLGLKPDEQIRTPMQWSGDPNAGFSLGVPWEPLNPDFSTVNVASQTTDPTSLLSTYRDLVSLRNRHAALRVGEFLPVKASDPAVFASLRVSRQEILLVAINLGEDPIADLTLSLPVGPLSGRYVALPATAQPAEPPLLAANANGGFDEYQLPSPLPAYSLMLLQLRATP
jgi:alpha-amylase